MTETSTYTHQELSARLAEVERERDELLSATRPEKFTPKSDAMRSALENRRVNKLMDELWDVYIDDDPDSQLKVHAVWTLLIQFEAEVIGQILKERNELAAMVGWGREALSPMADEADFVPPETGEIRLLYEMDGAQINELSFFHGEDFAHAKALLSETPSTALAEIRSEAAGRGYYDALVMCYERRFGYGTSEPYESDFEERAHEYTQQLRNGGE